IGYRDTIISVSSLNINSTIRLVSISYNLEVVDILPSENPAFAIIRKLINNWKKNNPENQKNFSYKAYHKFVVTGDAEAIKKKLADTTHIDSNLIEMDEFLSSQHLLIIESVSERYFKYPDKNKERIIATRVSGLRDPSFAFLSSQLQSFSFYNKTIDLMDKHYINPLTKASLNKYFYLLEDSIFSDFDTTYIISFRPYKGTNFDGLKGQVHISTRNFAIRNVIAEPADSAVDIGIRIQQRYEFINNEFWFPTQLNSDLIFYNVIFSGTYLKGIGRTYLRDIKVNQGFSNRIRFNNIVLEMDPNAGRKKRNEFWNTNRENLLDSLDNKTYRVVDSIGEAEHFDRKLWIYSSLINGRIPWGPIDMELDKFLQYNEFEGFRMGLGLVTNDRLSEVVQFGAYGAWATRDYQWKYGGSIDVNIWTRQKLKFKIEYQNDVFESAHQFNFGKKSMFNDDVLRNFVIKKMVYHKTLSSNIKFRALPHSTWNFGFNYSQINSPNNYQFVIKDDVMNYTSKGDFNIAEFQGGLRFAYKEKLMSNKLQTISISTKYPVLNIHYTKAISGIINSELDYQKVDIQIDYSYYLRFLGRTSWRIVAAKAFGNAPWYKLYNGKGSYFPFYIEIPNSFGTMRINEFLSDRFVAVYFKHDFGHLLFGNKPFIPQPSIVSSFTIGELTNTNLHKNIEYNTLEKGYYESGLLLNSILKSGITNIGFGVFYRYGPYAFDNVADNFSYKLTLKYGI
ncbi:MAG: hypothetical protein DRI86_08165, partial [Bacteroidetes bacterium]